MTFETAVVRILQANGRPAGTGFVASAGGLVVTCAHVLQADDNRPRPERVDVVFSGGQPRAARVVAWSAPYSQDVAVLQVEGDLPPGITPLKLASSWAPAGEFRSFGFPALDGIQGAYASGDILGEVHDGRGRVLLQVDSAQLARGFSGGPLVDATRGRVVGMVTAGVEPRPDGRLRDVAYATPVEKLLELYPPLAAPALPRTNPFFAGGRINDPQQFFGRQQLVREICTELKKRCSVSLIGASQMGKSSLLYYLYATRATWLPASVPGATGGAGDTVEYIDLQGVLDEADFCATVSRRLGEEGDTLRHLKRILETCPAILLLDEVERLAEADFNPRLHDILRSLAQGGHFAMCLATQRPLEEVFPARTPGGVSPFHNIFTRKALGPFSEAEMRQLLASRLAGSGVAFTPAEIERLIAQSAGSPAALQRLAKELFDDVDLR